MVSPNVPSTSFINLFKEITYDKEQNPNQSLDLWDALVINNFNKSNVRLFQMHDVVANDTWVGLARKYYDDERLWWVIPLFNDIEDPFLTVNSQLADFGITKLQILKPEKINQLLVAARQQKINNDRKKVKDGN